MMGREPIDFIEVFEKGRGFRDDIKILYIVKIDVLTPPPSHLSLQPNFPFLMGKGKFACKDRQLYPLPPSIFTM